jgi:hypothetical protein
MILFVYFLALVISSSTYLVIVPIMLFSVSDITLQIYMHTYFSSFSLSHKCFNNIPLRLSKIFFLLKLKQIPLSHPIKLILPFTIYMKWSPQKERWKTTRPDLLLNPCLQPFQKPNRVYAHGSVIQSSTSKSVNHSYLVSVFTMKRVLNTNKIKWSERVEDGFMKQLSRQGWVQ